MWNKTRLKRWNWWGKPINFITYICYLPQSSPVSLHIFGHLKLDAAEAHWNVLNKMGYVMALKFYPLMMGNAVKIKNWWTDVLQRKEYASLELRVILFFSAVLRRIASLILLPKNLKSVLTPIHMLLTMAWVAVLRFQSLPIPSKHWIS